MKQTQILCQTSSWAKTCLLAFVLLISGGFLYSVISSSAAAVLSQDLYAQTQESTLENQENTEERLSLESVKVPYESNMLLLGAASKYPETLLVVGLLTPAIPSFPRPYQHGQISSCPSQAPPSLA